MCSAMYLSKKRVERSTVAILKLELAQSGDGQAWGRLGHDGPSPDDDATSTFMIPNRPKSNDRRQVTVGL